MKEATTRTLPRKGAVEGSGMRSADEPTDALPIVSTDTWMVWESLRPVQHAIRMLEKACGQMPHSGTTRAGSGAAWDSQLEKMYVKALFAPVREVRVESGAE